MGECSDMVYLLCPNYAKVLCDGIKGLYEKKEWADLVLSVNGHESLVHTFMMAIFAPKLISHCEDNRCDLHGINVDQQTFATLLDFVYKGQVKVERDRLKMLRRGAGKLGLKVLVDVIDKETRANNMKRKSNKKSLSPDKRIKMTAGVKYFVEGEMEGYVNENHDVAKVVETALSEPMLPITVSGAAIESDTLNGAAVLESDTVDGGAAVESTAAARCAELKCPRCDYESGEIESFKNHLTENHELNLRLKYKCVDCEFVSQDKREVSIHRKQHHHKRTKVNARRFKCSHCDFVSDKKGAIRSHQRYSHSTEKPFSCQHDGCDYRGRTEKELNGHVEKQHDDVTYSCDECGKSFVGKFSLNNHVKLSHTEPDQRHTCQFCDFKTRYMLDLKRHQSEQHNYRQRRIQKRKVYTDADLKPCPHCGVRLKTKPLLIDHLAYRHQLDLDGNPIEPGLKCKLCDYVCWAHFQLHNHVYQNHTEKQFRCEHCDYACRRRRALTAHVLGKHFGQKAFMCELCGQCFSYNATLRRHLQLHDSGTAFSCSSCGKLFSQKVYLDSHVKNAHADTSSKHQCHLCSYSATTKGNLSKHVRRKHKDEEAPVMDDMKTDNEVVIQETVLEEIIIF